MSNMIVLRVRSRPALQGTDRIVKYMWFCRGCASHGYSWGPWKTTVRLAIGHVKRMHPRKYDHLRYN